MSLLDNLITSGDVTGLAAAVTALDGQVTALEAAVADLQVESAEYGPFDVRRFIPVGEVLSTINFEAAFDDAQDAAEAASTGLIGTPVYVPAGTWPITTAKARTNLTGYKRNVGIVGAGKGATVFDVTSALGDYTFSWEPPSKTTVPTDIGYGLLLKGFSVHGNGVAGGGFQIVHNLRARIDDVEVRDFTGAADYEDGFGLLVGADWSYNATARAEIQDQDMVVTNSSFSNNQGGICITRLVGSSPWFGVIAQQNLWLDFVGDGAQCSLLGIQYQSGGSAASATWHSGMGGGGHIGNASGWQNEIASGSAATMAVASGFETTIGNLGGVITAAHQWCWAEITASDGKGLYVVTEVVDSSTIKILKASTHGAETALAWRLLGTRGGNKITWQGSNYSEGDKRAGFLCLKDWVTASYYDLHLRDTNNCTYGAEAHGVAGTVLVRGGTSLSTVLWATECEDVQAPETLASKIIVDEKSRAGLVCRGTETKPDGTASQSPNVGVQTFNIIRSKRLRSAYKELSAVENWSSRLTSTLNLSGANVTQWDGSINGSTLGLLNAAKYPQYSASDSDFGGVPGVAFTGDATATNVAGLTGDILSAKFPSGTYTPSVFAVFHLPSSATKSYDRRINVSANSGTDYLIAMLYSVSFGADFGAQYHGNEGTGQVAVSPSSLLDSSARALLLGNSPRDGFWLQMDDGAKAGTLPGYKDFWTNVGNVTITLPTVAGLASETLHLAELTVFPHALTASQFRDLADLAANEIPNITARI